MESEQSQLGTAWSMSVALVDVAAVLERTMATRSQPIDDMVDPPTTLRHRMRAQQRSHRSRQRWLVSAACALLVVAGVVAVAQRAAGPERVATNPPTTPPVPTDTCEALSGSTAIGRSGLCL